jgi:threonine synthase
VGNDILKRLREIVSGGSVSEQEVADEIRRVFTAENYLIDTHTAVASAVLAKYREESNDQTLTVIDATASPFKVCQSVYDALAREGRADDEYMIINALKEMTGAIVPRGLKGLDRLLARPEVVIEVSEGRDTIRSLLTKNEGIEVGEQS